MLMLVFFTNGKKAKGRVKLTDDYRVEQNEGIPPVVVSDAILSLYRDNCRVGSSPPYRWELVSQPPEPVRRSPSPAPAFTIMSGLESIMYEPVRRSPPPTPPVKRQSWEYTLDDREAWD